MVLFGKNFNFFNIFYIKIEIYFIKLFINKYNLVNFRKKMENLLVDIFIYSIFVDIFPNDHGGIFQIFKLLSQIPIYKTFNKYYRINK